MSYTRTQIRQRIGGVEFLGDTLVSTASANGSTTTLVDTSQKQPDDWWNYGQIAFISGTAGNIGLVRYITDWVQSTSTFTLDRAVTSTVSADGYEAHRLSGYSDKNAAINAAILSGGKRWTRRVEDATLTLDTDTYTYSLGSLATPLDPQLLLDDIYWDTNAAPTGYPFSKIHPSFYVVRYSGNTPTLQFLNFIPIDGEALRLVYRVRPAQLATDAAVLAPDDDAFYNYVCAKASAILFRARALNAPDAGYEDKATAMEQMAEGFFDLERPQVPPKAVRNELLSWGEGYNRSGWW